MVGDKVDYDREEGMNTLGIVLISISGIVAVAVAILSVWLLFRKDSGMRSAKKYWPDGKEE